ncbi:MAG: hypothetical protein L3J41_15425 [Melioribacteraceae bacterium]|nr:hypothetical protein [Melioribacteraceae bacterium]
MNRIEKILELLSKEKLTTEEKIYLSSSFDEEPELKKYKAIYNLLGDMKNSFHLNSDLISEYVLYRNNLPLEDNSIIKFIPQIENHISKCSKCREEFELFNEEYNAIDNYLNQNIKQDEKTSAASRQKSFQIFNLFTRKHFYAAAAVIAFFTFSLFTTSQLMVPSYKNISELSELNYSTTRGRVSPSFHNGLKALSNDNYDEAITQLESDIENNYDDKTIFYTNYMLGLVYLKKSESDFLGLFTSFNVADINNSIVYFKKSIAKNNSGSFSNITYNSYFYIGKGYLLIDDFANAKINLQTVVDNNGSYSNEARELIEIINQEM